MNGTELTFTPEPDFAGEATITYRAVDTVGAVSEDATITVTVEADDDAPTAITLSEIPVAENTEGAVVATVTVDDVDSTYVAADLDLTDPSGKFELADDNGAVVLKLKVGEALDFEATEQPALW